MRFWCSYLSVTSLTPLFLPPTSGDESAVPVSFRLAKKVSQFSIRISTTWLLNLMSMMEATVSSFGLSRVGPKQTPKFEAVIRFLSDLEATLDKCRTKTLRISRLAIGNLN